MIWLKYVTRTASSPTFQAGIRTLAIGRRLSSHVGAKSWSLCITLALLASSAQGALLDDFSGDLSSFTGTTILDNNGGPSNTSLWTNTTGELSLDTTNYDGIEQIAFIYDGVSLGIGQELQADFSSFPITGNRNFGLYVGGSAPTVGVRQDYITIYGGTNSTVASRGFDGVDEYNNPGADGASADSLFIARTDVNTFEAGFYAGSERTVVTTRTPVTPNSADYLGFYADVREAGTIGYADNLRIVPEPSAVALALCGVMGLCGRVRGRLR